jgi:hypothetical protein
MWAVPGRFFQSLPIPCELVTNRAGRPRQKRKNYKKRIETNETRKGKYSEIILKEKKNTKMKKPNKE